MIRYALKCDKDHGFESWFQSASAYDGLRAAGHVQCPVCGSGAVEKAVMAPSVQPGRNKATAGAERPDLKSAESPEAEALTKLKNKIEAESEYVGMRFASEARAMHDGDSPERPIYGEARPDEARKLIEDGVPVLPLPFLPGRKAN